MSVSEISSLILARHADYGWAARAEIDWPRRSRTAPVDDWLTRVARFLDPGAYDRLHGRALIAGLALADAPSGRCLVESGAFFSLVQPLYPSFLDALSDEGREALQAIPLAAAAAGAEPPTLPNHEGSIAFAYDGTLAAADEHGKLNFREPDGTASRTVEVGGPVEYVVGAEGTRLAHFDTGDRRGRVTVYDLVAGEKLFTVAHGAKIERALFSGGGERLATFGGRRVMIWDTEGNELTRVSRGSGGSTSFSRDGSLLSFAGGDEARALDTSTGQWVCTVEFWDGTASLSPDGTLLATVSGGSPPRPLQLWHVSTGEQAAEGPATHGPLAWSPDGRALAAGPWVLYAERGFQAVHLGVEDGPSHRPVEPPRAVAFSPDGKRLAVAGPDTLLVRVDDVAVLAHRRLQLRVPATQAAYSPDGRSIAFAGESGGATIWLVGLGAAERALTRYAADEADGSRDLLDIEADVERLAMLIAARAVDPPLSIGLFGEWGSGKTFFMRALRRRVDELAHEASRSGRLQKEVGYYKRIVQIEFNAWHYAEGNLWASLVEYILSNLSLPDEPGDVVEQRRAELLEHLGAEQSAAMLAEQEAEQAEQELQVRQAELANLEAEHARVREELADATSADAIDSIDVAGGVPQQAVAALTNVGLGATVASGWELVAALRDARAMLKQGNRLLLPLARDPERKRRYYELMAVAVGAPLVALATGLAGLALGTEAVATLTASTAGLAALLGGSARWIRQQTEWSAERLNEIEQARSRLDEVVSKKRAEQERERMALEKELELVNERVRAAHDARTAQRQRVEEIRAAAAAVTPASELARLIQDRLSSGDYRRHLGLLALVQRDFTRIADYLRLQARDIAGYRSLAEETEGGGTRINRIVLYIDDLDRCEPGEVVKVLQAVHLLLAFPLFVVVVGVDARWVGRALAKRYPELLAADGAYTVFGRAATARDYLEKIFQIPFWLEPLAPATTKQMLRGLVSPAAASPAGTPQAHEPVEPNPVADDAEDVTGTSGPGLVLSGSRRVGRPARTTTTARSQPRHARHRRERADVHGRARTAPGPVPARSQAVREPLPPDQDRARRRRRVPRRGWTRLRLSGRSPAARARERLSHDRRSAP